MLKAVGSRTYFNKKLVNEMLDFISRFGLIDYGGARMKDFLSHFGMDYNTFKSYRKKYTWFNDEVEKAKEDYKASLAIELAHTLRDAAKGGYKEEEDEVTEYRPNPDNPSMPTVARMTKTKRKKYIKPDVAAAIFLVTNIAPEHFQNRQRVEASLRKEDDTKMTLAEINAEIERLEKGENHNQ